MTTFQTDYDRRTDRMGRDRAAPEPSLASLIRDATRDVARLFRQEVELAKTETSEKLQRLAASAGALIVGSVLALSGLTVLLFGLGVGLSELLLLAGLDAAWAAWLGPALVGLAVLLIGGIMAAIGANKIKKTNMMPQKTVDSLRETGDWVRDHRRNGHAGHVHDSEEVRA